MTDKINNTLKNVITELERDLELQISTVNSCIENSDLNDKPIILTTFYYLLEKYKSDGKIESILKSRGFELNPDFFGLKKIEKLLRRGFNKCVDEEKEEYLLAFKKMIYLQLLQVDMNDCPHLKEVFGEAPNNNALLKDVYRVVKKGCYSIGETLSFRNKDYDPSYTDDYWHKIEND